MTTKHLVYTALMTAIICILGLVPSVPLPFMPVPIVLQNIGIFLAGIILGRKLGTTSGVFAGPSAGFLFLYPVVAYFIGIIRDAYLHKINFLVIFIATLVIGVLGLDILGTLIMGFIIHIPISKAFILSFTFMPGDIIKAIIASLIGAAILNHSRFKTLIQ